MIQYRAAPVIIGAFKVTSCDHLYETLDLDSLSDRK